MSRIEASISLLIITLFASLQYLFLAEVPSSVSGFAFLCITNLVGFAMSLAFFFGELFRLDSHQIIQSVILASELVAMNLCILLGAEGMQSTVTAAVLSSYFVFVAAFSAILAKKLPDRGILAGVTAALVGVFLAAGADIGGLMNVNVLYLALADVIFALYILTAGSYASSSNPSILAMGQMFFCFIFSLIFWAREVFFSGGSFVLPSSKNFWGAVIYVSFFIRGLYTVIQIYAQRYINPLNTSLIFSTELVMTLLISPVLSRIFGTVPENVTPMKLAGSILIVAGLLITEPGIRHRFVRIAKRIFRREHFRLPLKNEIDLKIIIISAVAYAVIDLPVLVTGLLPIHTGIKNFLPLTTGLFFGFSGVIGCCAGSVISFAVSGLGMSSILRECGYIFLTGIGMWYCWYLFSGLKTVHFREPKHYAVYCSIVFVLSALCFNFYVSLSYFLCGILISLPLDILMGSIFGVSPILPGGRKVKDDAAFVIDSSPESLSNANEALEVSGSVARSNMKQIFEIESCIEELSIRIINSIPDAVINVGIRFGYAVSVNMTYKGAKYNPFIINKGEDVLDIMSLKIIKHRALRASYAYSGGENSVHVVV